MFLFGSSAKTRMVTPEDALPGRSSRPFAVPATHAVLGTPLQGPFPEGLQSLYVGLGCFWGA
jgi:peptide-methionine (S)-S-oxide reductase